jgi:hypothetical protein
MKCQCLPDDDQSDPTNITEQMCGFQKDGVTYGCTDSKGCGQCSDPDTRKCNNGCPVLNQPYVKPGTKPVVAKKKHHHTAPKKKPTRWWLWGLLGFLALVVIIGIIVLVRSSSSSVNSNNAS